MSGLSRRDFFQRFGHSLSDQIDLEKIQKLMPWQKEKGRTSEDAWVAVGSLSIMTPGAKCRVQIDGNELSLEADAEGIWLARANGCRIAIRLGQGGVILANLSLEWPNTRVLSQSSGEPKELEETK